jgi:hypothetical protein
MVPTGFDPITFNHWLWFKYKCHEGTSTEFQRLFEDIVSKLRPDFMRVRAYGKLGDRKCDGLFRASGTVFQVYAPDEMKQDALEKKIEEDLDGAYLEWQDEMKEWVFVYHVRRGVPPEIPSVLNRKQTQYPTLTLHHWSSDRLWEIARDLPLQQRAEILGPPTGYEHLFFRPGVSTEEVNQAIGRSWFVLVQDVMSPINIRDVVTALEPDQPFGAPFFIRPTVGDPPWELVARSQQRMIADVLEKSRDIVPRYAVFSLAPIPLVIHLGFVLSDRVQVRYFQYHRDLRTWRWPDVAPEDVDTNMKVTGLPNELIDDDVEVVVRVSLSAPVTAAQTRAVVRGSPIEVDITVTQPDVLWLRHPDQLKRVEEVFRRVLTAVRNYVPSCPRIHLFYAGPTPAAVIIGQVINPRMNPPVELYEYSRQWTPYYRRALTLQEERQ